MAAAPVRIALVGDSTVTDEAGWGSGFRPAGAQVLNFARSGRSSKSYLAEGHWRKALDSHPDYVLLQFGHNDQPGKGPERETDPDTTFRENMARYVDEARAAGAKPVLLTSLIRRNFGPDGKVRVDALARYAEAVRKLAAEKQVPLIDLYAISLEMANQMGPKAQEEFGRPGPDGAMDNTHLSPNGSRIIGEAVAREFARVTGPTPASH